MAQVIPQQFEAAVSIHRLHPHPRNPRHGDGAAIRESIAENGFYGAVIAQKSTGHILVGNHRYAEAVKEDLTALPVFWYDCDDETALRILLADNRLSDIGSYDDVLLAELVQEIANTETGLVGTGYDDAALQQLLESLEEEIMPDFKPGSEDEQGRLDERAKVACPECGHEFVPKS